MNATFEQKSTEAFFKPRRFAHVNIFVDGYEKAADFYTNVVGFEEVYRQPVNLASFLSNGNTYHDFALLDVRCRHAAENQKPGLFHIALELETEVDLVEGYRKALAAGVKFDHTMDHDVAHSVYTTDPDGNIVEIYADVIQDWRPIKHGESNKEKPQWIPGVTTVPIAEPLHPMDPEIRVIQDSIFRGRRVTHVSFVTDNYESMFDYYTGYAGLVPFAGDRNSDFCVLRGSVGLGDISLVRNRHGHPNGLHHVGIEVANDADLDRALSLLDEHGLTLEAHIKHPARRVVHITSPDGMRLQFYVNRDWSETTLAGLSDQEALYLL